jgi:ATPase family associated with various cellular activities (AAA)
MESEKPMTTATLAFPQSLTEAYKPQSISEFVGLEKQKKILSSLAANPRACALLFQGGPGTGKTSMAFAFARTVGAEVHHVPSQDCSIDNLKRVVDSCHRVPWDFATGKVYKWHIVIIDEGDRMSGAAQIFLLSKLDGTDPCPNTIWVLTCNSDESFEPRFLSRIEYKLPKFNGYGTGSGVRDLLARIWQDRGNGAPEPDYARIPTGNVREALQALEVELLAA